MSYTTRVTLIQRLQEAPTDESWQQFSDIYSGYISCIIRGMNLRHQDVEDLKQQVLVKVWKGLANFQYDPGRAKFRTWLRTVVKNTIRSYIKLKSTRMADLTIDCRTAMEQYLGAISLPEVDRIAETEWQLFILHRALEAVRPRFKPVVMQSFEGMSLGRSGAEVAEELGIPRNTVLVYRHRVRRALIKEIIALEYELG